MHFQHFAIFVALLTLSVAQEDNLFIEHYYTVNSDKDADYYISQVYTELEGLGGKAEFYGYPYGGMQITQDEDGKYYCHAKGDVCRISVFHYCIETMTPNQKAFLSCYFQSEFYPLDMYSASQQCFGLQNNPAADWNTVIACATNAETMVDFSLEVINSFATPPFVEETPRVYLNFEYSALAAADLKKAICRENAADIWQCESVNQFKEPLVQVFYSVYDQTTTDFFTTQLSATLAEKIMQTTSELDVIPNPNKVLDCGADNETCWNYHAHWCFYEQFAGLTQLEKIQCTFNKTDATSGPDRVQQCLSEDEFLDIKNCIAVIDSMTGPITALQNRLNQLVDVSQQQSVEVIVKDEANVKAKKNGLLQELCYNYFYLDDETLGCKVDKPKVQIFYETQSTKVGEVFEHMLYVGRYAPFETVASFEFVPYGKTEYLDGKYSCSSESQCSANWIHGCILQMHYNTLQEQFLFMQFFACATAYYGTDPMNQTESCVNQVYNFGSSFWSSLVQCAETDDALKESLRNKTEAITLTQVPEITINGEKKTEEVGDHLLTTLCRSFDPIKPRVCFNIDTESNQQSLQMTVFLTANENSQKLVQSQIKSLLTSAPSDGALALRDVINWQFVPWGPSTLTNETDDVEGRSTVECTNGANECLGNRIIACAARQMQTGHLGNREDQQRVVNFVICFFDSTSWQENPLDAANQCASKLSPLDSYQQLWQCAVQEDKLQFLLDMKQLTANNYPPIEKFPEVAINGQRVVDLSDLALTLCSYYESSARPSECPTFTEPPTTVEVTTVTQTITTTEIADTVKPTTITEGTTVTQAITTTEIADTVKPTTITEGTTVTQAITTTEIADTVKPTTITEGTTVTQAITTTEIADTDKPTTTTEGTTVTQSPQPTTTEPTTTPSRASISGLSKLMLSLSMISFLYAALV